MAGHTPGPWATTPRLGGVNIVADSQIVASTTKIDARLIAAAPDLLDALKRYVAQDFEKECTTAADRLHNLRLEAARQAIEKAEGGDA